MIPCLSYPIPILSHPWRNRTRLSGILHVCCSVLTEFFFLFWALNSYFLCQWGTNTLKKVKLWSYEEFIKAHTYTVWAHHNKQYFLLCGRPSFRACNLLTVLNVSCNKCQHFYECIWSSDATLACCVVVKMEVEVETARLMSPLWLCRELFYILYFVFPYSAPRILLAVFFNNNVGSNRKAWR